jgi:hypothetical protein
MKKDTEITKVQFYIATYTPSELDEQPFSEVLAVFPEMPNKDNGFDCYANLGQHSICHSDFIKNNCKDATKEQYKDLFNELENIGYNLEVLNAD